VTNGAQIIYSVQDPKKPSITAATPREPGPGYDLSQGYQPLPGGKRYSSYAEALLDLLGVPATGTPATGAQYQALGTPATAAPKAQPVTNITRTGGIPRNDSSLNDTVYSELAARAYAQMKGISVEQARTEIQSLPTVKQTLIQAASSGALDNLAPELAGTQVSTQQASLDRVAQAAGYPSWQEYSAALQEGARQKAELEKRKAEQELELARTADERAAAYLKLQEADQRLAETKYEAEKQQYAQSLAAQLLQMASNLRGPRNYAQFMQMTSGGRDLLTQLFGDQARALFSSPTGELDPATLGGLFAQTQSPAGNQALPLPHQINPAVWDSLGQVGQSMVLSMAEAAGYDPDEFVRQLNASRPVGTAARQVRYTFSRAA
jgi:hypothetical protein